MGQYVKKSENPQRPRVSLFTCALSPTKLSPGSLEGFLEGREAQKDSGWLRPGGHWPRGGWMPRKKRHRGGAKAWKLRKLLSTGVML